MMSRLAFGVAVLFATQAHAQNNEQANAPIAPQDPFLNDTALGQDSPTFTYGENLVAVGKLADAARVFRLILKANPDDLLANERLREVYALAQRPELAGPVLQKLVEIYHAQGNGERASLRYDELIAAGASAEVRDKLGRLIGRISDVKPNVGTTWEQRARSLLGIFVILGIGFVFSTSRKRVKWRPVVWGIAIQLVMAVIVLWTPPGRRFFAAAQTVVERIIAFSDEGALFVFGNLYRGVMPIGAQGPLQMVDGTSHSYVNLGFVFAFHVLPTIVFIGALMGVLYHYGIIQVVVRGIAWAMMKTMGTSGAESLSTAANIFVGQTEAPLVVKPYLNTMTRSELHAIMVGGFATVAGGVLAAYVRFGIDAGHLLAASFMGGPATLVLAKIMVPETEEAETSGKQVKDPPRTTRNVLDAATGGASEGLTLAVNVGAMLVAFIALVAMINWGLGVFGISLGEIFGYLFYPLSWCMGVDTNDLLVFGNLMGQKVALNEFVAYVDLARVRPQISERTFVVATYALCGFANFSSIGIQIGGLAAMAPERRQDIASLGLRAMVAGALATALTACVAGLMI